MKARKDHKPVQTSGSRCFNDMVNYNIYMINDNENKIYQNEIMGNLQRIDEEMKEGGYFWGDV